MKYSAILLLALCCTVTQAKSVDEEKHYSMEITELGTTFEETVDVDVENGYEIFTVPAHNDIDATIYIHHFPTMLQMEVLREHGVCFLQDMTRSSRDGVLPDPRHLVESFEEHDSLESDDEQEVDVETVEDNWAIGREVSDVEKEQLPVVMQRHCDGLKMFHTRRITDGFKVSTGSQHENQARSLSHSYLEQLQMLSSHHRSARGVTPRCSTGNLASRCKVERRSCGHYKTRTDIYRNCQLRRHHTGRSVNVCNRVRHNIDTVLCCRECCTVRSQADSFFPHCDSYGTFQCGTPGEDKYKKW